MNVRGMKMTQIEALCLNVGEYVMLEWEEVCSEGARIRRVNSETLHLTLNGFNYHFTVEKFASFVAEKAAQGGRNK